MNIGVLRLQRRSLQDRTEQTMATLQFQKKFLTVIVRDKRTRCYSYENTYIKELKSRI
jgi:hypothetical protein